MFKNESERWLWKTGDDTKRRGSIGQSNGANRVLSMNTPPQDRLFTKYHPEKKLTKLQRTNREKMFAESFVQLDSQHGPDHLISPPTWWQCWCNIMGSKRGSNQPFPENNKRFHQKPTFSSLADAPLLAVIFVTVPFLVSIFIPILMIICKVILVSIPISMMIGQFDWLAIQC